MRRNIFTLVLLLTSLFLFAQRPVNKQLRTLTKLDLGLQGVGITFEPKIGKSATIDLSTGIGGGYDIWLNELTYKLDITNPAIYFSVTPKFFYNRKKRAESDKTTALNAGNYIGLRLRYTTKGLAENSGIYDALLMNLHWGLQRPLGKKWSFATHVGAGYATDATDLNHFSGTVYPALEFRFSYVFTRQKS
ncbi:hypothetical protein [Terrimonas pollutisoli]|uniref:hypothetical protein n=1 Tax=Terrimonas pollutisoli TaxID=3034147 RepID=UPI0023EA9EEF|nr:hypothetical protein [Terrimonas sp. H1YJ31]